MSPIAPPRPSLNARTDVFPNAKLNWEGVKFSFAGTAHLDLSRGNVFPYMASFPMPYATDWAPGDYKMTATGSIDPTGSVLKDFTMHLEWKGKPGPPNMCWDLAEKTDSFSYTYTLKDIPLKEKGPYYQYAKDSGLMSYQFEVAGDALKAKMAAFSHSQRWCLHPGETYDAAKLNAAGDPGKFTFKLGFVKKK